MSCGCGHEEGLHGAEAREDDHREGHGPEAGGGDGGRLEIAVEPVGPGEGFAERAAAALAAHPRMREILPHDDHRMIAVVVDDEHGRQKRGTGCPPDRFVATVYDYAERQVVEVRGALDALDPEAPGGIETRVLGHQPLPSGEEFEAAVEILRHDRAFRGRLASGELEPYRPMPPVIVSPQPDGTAERVLAVGLRGTRDGEPFHEVVGVSMFDRRIISGVIDGVVHPGPRVCEPPAGAQRDGGRDPGQCWVTVTSGGQTLWRFLAVRPSASSGTNGSGVELRYVDYRGKRVLYRAHLPILNVEYDQGGQEIGCGPTYRDWQNSETWFEASGTPVAPGFLLCPQPARTIIDSGSDSGGFSGVAIFVEGSEVVLVSEMQAGWYRYISQWRLHADGTIRPRFGFAGTQNRCTCNRHVHHAYWRFDFDVRTADHNTVEEFNDPPIVGAGNWHTKRFEIRRPRDAQHRRRWRVRNTRTGEAYTIVPGRHDGQATAYGVGDLWVLRYRADELDDGQGFTTDPALSRAHLERFMTPPESVTDTDVVVWYAAHYTHDAGIEVGNWVGPDLVPSGW